MDISTLKKIDVKILILWLGGRLWDHRDLDAFRTESYYGGLGYTIISCPYPFSPKEDLSEYREALLSAKTVISGAIEKREAIAVFTILNWDIIKFIERKKTDKSQFLSHEIIPKDPLLFNYRIVMDGSFWNKKKCKMTPHGKANEFGAIWSYFNGDAQTAGGRRLTDLIARIMGYDLPGEEFPDYNWEDLKKIGQHISRESFNSDEPPSWAIPKYKIGENGRPIFPELLEEE